MNSNKVPNWVRYSPIAVIVVILGVVAGIPALELPSPQSGRWNPLIGVEHAIVVGAAFTLVLFVASFWLKQRDDRRRRFDRGRALLVFVIFAVGDLVVEVTERPSFLVLSHHASAERFIAYLVQAGGGSLAPLIILALFAVVIFVRFRRRSQ